MTVKKGSEVKHIADIVGEWGKWQLYIFLYLFILNVCAINNMGYSFHAYDNDFYCSDVPKDYPNKTKHMKCFQFSNPNQTCNDWQYDRTEFQTSIKTEFDLVCHRTYFAAISQAFYMLGYIGSGLVFAHYSDKNGRRPMIWICFIIEMIGILCCALSPNIYFYTIGRFMSGMGSSGRYAGLKTMLLECVGPKYRADVSIISGVGWVVGHVLIPGLAYWLQNFRYMQFASIPPMIIMMGWYYFLYESPRWQVTNGQVDKAEVTLRIALKMNGKSDHNLKAQLTELSSYLQEMKSKESKSHSILDLFRTPNLRKVTLIMWYSWIVNALIYYGISFNMSDFGGNLYISFLLSGLVELPSQVLAAVLLRFIGRCKVFSFFMAMAAVSCFAVIPSTNDWLKVTFALSAKFAINSSWAVLGTQGPELYPTNLRHIGYGASAVVGRIGSIAAPFMKNVAETRSLALVMVLYGTLSSIGAILALFVPETRGYEMPDTIEEAENRSKLKMKKINNNLTKD